MTNNEIAAKVARWCRDNDYEVLSISPMPQQSGLLPRAVVGVVKPEEVCPYVVWTATIMENGDVSVVWGTYLNNIDQARDEIMRRFMRSA